MDEQKQISFRTFGLIHTVGRRGGGPHVGLGRIGVHASIDVTYELKEW